MMSFAMVPHTSRGDASMIRTNDCEGTFLNDTGGKKNDYESPHLLFIFSKDEGKCDRAPTVTFLFSSRGGHPISERPRHSFPNDRISPRHSLYQIYDAQREDVQVKPCARLTARTASNGPCSAFSTSTLVVHFQSQSLMMMFLIFRANDQTIYGRATDT